MGRIEASRAIHENMAGGINIRETVMYPNDIGLGNEGEGDSGERISDIVYVWGP